MKEIILFVALLFPILSFGQATYGTVEPTPMQSKAVVISPLVDDVDSLAIFLDFDEQAKFPGDFRQYLANNIIFPDAAQENDVSGKVIVSFTVEKDGAVSDIKLIRSLGFGCDEEVIRVVKKMPNWSPARKDGKPVRSRMLLPVAFVLQ